MIPSSLYLHSVSVSAKKKTLDPVSWLSNYPSHWLGLRTPCSTIYHRSSNALGRIGPRLCKHPPSSYVPLSCTILPADHIDIQQGLFITFEAQLIGYVKTLDASAHDPKALIALHFATYAAIVINVAGILGSQMLIHDLTALPDLIRNSENRGIVLEEGKRGVELLASLAGSDKGFGWRFRSCELPFVALRDDV